MTTLKIGAATVTLPSIEWKEFAAVRVDGVPKAQPRARAVKRGKHAGVYDPGTADGWKNLIAEAMKPHRPEAPLDGPIRLWLDIFFPRPKYMMAKKYSDHPILHTAKPDRDNCEKAICDILTQIGFWRDDAQVCGGEVNKWYVGRDGRPGCSIIIDVLDTEAGAA